MIDKSTLIDTEEFNHSFRILRHQAFMKDLAPHLIGGIPSALFILYFFYDFSNTVQRFIWLGSYLFICLFSVFLYQLQKKKPDFFDLEQWEKINHLTIILLALFWSLPGFLFLDTTNLLYVMVLNFHILATCVSPAAAIIYYPKAYIAFITLPMLALFLALVSNDIQYGVINYLMPPACAISLLIYGITLKSNVFHALRLQVENTLAWQSAQKSAIAKSTFLAAASHDIRQPLQAISLLLEAFNEKKQSTHNLNILKHLKSSVNSMSELLNRLLDVSKLDAQVIKIEPEHIDIRTLCETLLAELKQQNQIKAIDFNLSCPPTITAHADPVIVKRVLSNLLNNALRYTERGSITLSANQHQQTIKISVTDTGIGIKDTEKKAIFDEFYQSNVHGKPQKGLGLGLSIVKRLCELHGWDISFTSTYLQGSTFTIAVDAGDASAINTCNAPAPLTTLQDISVVIIDDEPIILEGLKSLLEKWGCHVIAYEDPERALNELTDTNTEAPDLVITDYRLGHHKNGIEIIQSIHQHSNANIEAIVITGDTGIEQIQDAEDSGYVVLHKPIKPAQLRKAIQLKMKGFS